MSSTYNISSRALALGIMFFVCTVNMEMAHAVTPSLEDIYLLVKEQQAQIDRLEKQLLEQSQGNEQKLVEMQEQLNSSSAVQESRIAQTESVVDETLAVLESRSFEADMKKTTIGGYGELHYNNLDNKEEIDLHRFVLFFSHQFRDDLSFYSELEVEHSIAGEGKVGEVEVEQAFVQWDYAANHSARGGAFLIPVGILNETHEPDTFYGVERNTVEKNVLPATWWEGGVAFNGELLPGWSYDLAMH